MSLNNHPRIKRIRKEREARLMRLLCQFRCMNYWASKRKRVRLQTESKMRKSIESMFKAWKGIKDYDKIDIIGVTVAALVIIGFILYGYFA